MWPASNVDSTTKFVTVFPKLGDWWLWISWQTAKVLTTRLCESNQKTHIKQVNCHFEWTRNTRTALTRATQYKHAQMFWKTPLWFPTIWTFRALDMHALHPSNCTICYMVWDTPWCLNRTTWGDVVVVRRGQVGHQQAQKCTLSVSRKHVALDVDKSAKQTCPYSAKHVKIIEGLTVHQNFPKLWSCVQLMPPCGSYPRRQRNIE